MTTESIVGRVSRNGLCTGCGLCESIAGGEKLKVAMSALGYLRPQELRPLSREDEGAIRAACPGIRVEHSPKSENYHPIWGPLLAVRTGNATDPEVRRNGSSGGVLSALCIHLLESGSVDFVAQIAVSENDPLANELQLSRTREDVLRAAGSRYAPSAPLRRLDELLETGKRFAFAGKPCDVAALRQYARLDPRVNAQVPYMFSFMCAGIPSIQGTYKVLEKMGAQKEDVESFRYRGDGWPGMARAVTHSGEAYEMDYNSSWGNILGHHLQFRCKICPDGTGEFADIVCADAWYSKDGYPDFEERDGRSLVLARTREGESLLERALAARAVECSALPAEDVEKMQPYQVARKKVVLGRTLAARLRLGVAPHYRKMGLIRASLKSNPLDWLRNAWGTYKRARGEI